MTLSALATVVPSVGEFRDWLERQQHYLSTLRDNGQLALALFLVAFAGILFVGAYRKRARIIRARASIPLSIGGWGTRGKSGTERLKAALFHGLGYEVSVKTTGCEAMLIHAVPDDLAHEIFIFRSYDKSTIWEQRDTVEVAAALGSEVFLWECMALQPEFVQLLQNDWMRDDFVTLTNAFPDHEDIQGPAGADVAECISSFIPKNSTLLTSELSFLPLFREKARQRGTEMHAIPARAGDMIAQDVLDLFPYSEHPRNISLVAATAELLGLERDLAIATMAEHVVPDLGVLKMYPGSRVRGRILRFINGMSANERTGFMNNWQRMQLDVKSLDTMPHEVVVTVVNNRWDRVSRSEVFARIMVEDAHADAHVLIGTNLRGIKRYYQDALKKYCQTIEVVVAEDLEMRAGASLSGARDRNAAAVHARDRLATLMARVRIPPATPRHLTQRIDVYAAGANLRVDPARRADVDQLAARVCDPNAGGLGLLAVRREIAQDFANFAQLLVPAQPPSDPPEVIAPATRDDCVEAIMKLASRMAVHARLRARVTAVFEHGADLGACNRVVRDAYRELFEDLVVVIEDSGASGDYVIDACARSVPPGTTANLLGIQNIKGTGLDFVYRWLALEHTTARLARLDSEEQRVRLEALRELEAFEDYGLVDAAVAAHELTMRESLERPDDDETTAMRTVAAKLRALHDEKKRALEETAQRTFKGTVLAILEAVLDPLDSVRRRRLAWGLMRDLVNRRISHARASKEMRALYERQDGWLTKSS